MRRFAPLACLGLVACAQAEAEPDKPLPGDYVRVIDGDTLEIRGEVIRLSNIDAPETGSRAECWAEASLGAAATEHLVRIVTLADELAVVREGKDRYGRTLAQVSAVSSRGEHNDLGEGLMFYGLASKWTGKQWDWCAPVDPNDPNGPRHWSAQTVTLPGAPPVDLSQFSEPSAP